MIRLAYIKSQDFYKKNVMSTSLVRWFGVIFRLHMRNVTIGTPAPTDISELLIWLTWFTLTGFELATLGLAA
jgi:hypothetical protein